MSFVMAVRGAALPSVSISCASQATLYSRGFCMPTLLSCHGGCEDLLPTSKRSPHQIYSLSLLSQDGRWTLRRTAQKGDHSYPNSFKLLLRNKIPL